MLLFRYLVIVRWLVHSDLTVLGCVRIHRVSSVGGAILPLLRVVAFVGLAHRVVEVSRRVLFLDVHFLSLFPRFTLFAWALLQFLGVGVEFLRLDLLQRVGRIFALRPWVLLKVFISLW